jgi:excisionase family DNA binding protein
VLVDHAAEILGVSRRTVYYRIRDGRLLTVRTRCGSQRVLIESIEALLREETSTANDYVEDGPDRVGSVRAAAPLGRGSPGDTTTGGAGV